MHASTEPRTRWVTRVAAVTSAGLIAAGLWGASPASATACVFVQGDGSVGDPYRVASRADLEQIEHCADKAFLQTADIDLGVGGAWVPLVSGAPGFTGTYDGGNHTISNMTTDTGATNRGLFVMSTGATIKNLTVTGATIGGGDTVGALVAEPASTTIADITVTGAVTGGTNVGGVVGSATAGTTLTRVSFSGTINGGFSSGGILGAGDAVAVTDVSVTGTTLTGEKRTGGLVGLANDSTVSRAAVAATITGNDINTGGLVGESRDTSIGESTATVAITATEAGGGLVGLNVAGTVSQSSVSGTVQGGTKLGGAVGHSDGGTIEDVSADVAVTGTGPLVGGLAGGLLQSMVSDSVATGAVSGDGSVGGLVGNAGNLTSISGSRASGNVTAAAWNGGGLVGRAGSGMTIAQSTATGDVTGPAYVGGLLGNGDGDGTISQSSATGTVTSADVYAGGLVGSGNGTRIHESFATGAVSGTENVGGLVGNLAALSAAVQVTDSYATGAVSATDIGGGLIGYGYQEQSFQVINSYAAGPVTVAGANSGGLIGQPDGDVGVTQSFWDSTANPTLSGGSGTPKTTTQLRTKATFVDAGWAIQTGGGTPVGGNVWGICEPPAAGVNSGYPYLLWQHADDPCPTVPAAPTLAPLTAGDTTLGVAAQLGADGGLPVTDVQYRLDDGAWTSSGGTTGSFTISGLTNGTTYRVRVRAVNESGASDPSNERTGTPAAAPVPTPTPTPTPTPETTLVVSARAGGKALPVGKRTLLVRNVRTNGTITSVHATCTVKGQRLPARVRQQVCGLRVTAPSESSAVDAAAMKWVRISAKPACSRGLRIQVRLAAKATGAARQVFTRTYRVDRTPRVTCRINGTG